MISPKLASDKADVGKAHDLCQQWLDWRWRDYPSDWPVEGYPIECDRFKDILQNLSNLHARPRGGIFWAQLDKQPMRFTMYNAMSAGVAEFNRMFVSEAGRGQGLGRLLLDKMINQMIEDGYQN